MQQPHKSSCIFAALAAMACLLQCGCGREKAQRESQEREMRKEAAFEELIGRVKSRIATRNEKLKAAPGEGVETVTLTKSEYNYGSPRLTVVHYVVIENPTLGVRMSGDPRGPGGREDESRRMELRTRGVAGGEPLTRRKNVVGEFEWSEDRWLFAGYPPTQPPGRMGSTRSTSEGFTDYTSSRKAREVHPNFPFVDE